MITGLDLQREHEGGEVVVTAKDGGNQRARERERERKGGRE